MAKTNIAKRIFWGVVIVLGATGAIVAYKKFIAVPSASGLADKEEAKAKGNPTPENVEAARQARITADLSNTIPANTFPLKRGSRGAFVKKMQQWMIDNKGTAATLPKYGADGIFGSETEAAVKKFLSQDGIVTQQKYNTLFQSSAATAVTADKVSTTDLLGKTAYAIANGVDVYNNASYSSIYKTAKKDEWIGTISNFTPDSNYLITTGNRYVARKLVYAK